jgi:flagellar protein FlaJ
MVKVKGQKIVPFNFLPMPILLGISNKFIGIGARIAKAFPYLKVELKQAEMDFEAEEYGAIAVTLFILYFFLTTFIFLLLALKFDPEKGIFLAPTIGAILSFLILIQVSMYPKIRVKKKVRDLESNLIFALRTMLVQIQSGVSLFDAMSVVAEGDYGAVSKEFRKAVEAINTGEFEEEALQKIAMNNPSPFFRRALWQLVNGMKAGADITDVMQELVSTMIKEESIGIRKYGSDLRLLSLMYMMIGVIIPALGITFLIVVSSFPQVQLEEWIYWILLIVVVVGQFMFLGIIKSKRPTLIEA